MMVRVVHTYKEPIVIYLLRSGSQRTRRNLLINQSIEVSDEEVSPELRQLARKGYVQLIEVVPPALQAIAIAKEDDAQSDAVDAPTDEVDIETLEKELLQ